MKVGLIARSEDRGLGNLTWEWAQHMAPDRVLLVEPNHAIQQRRGRYDDPTVVHWNHHGDAALDERVVRAWLDGLDVVYSAETFYDWRVCDWAREAGVRTVCHVMPEYYRHGQPTNVTIPKPDVWWTPTSWRLDQLAPGTIIVPVPIATERFRCGAGTATSGPPRWLHIGGARAASDRNGTRLVIGAMRHLHREHVVRIRTQAERIPRPQLGRHVHLEAITTPAVEYWDLYHDADAMVLPRRYAGLSLPAIEAMAAGCALMMSDVEPQRSDWPIIAVPAARRGHVRTAAGMIEMADVNPKTLAGMMDDLADDPAALQAHRKAAVEFAESQSWARLEPLIREELERVCATPVVRP